jgi:hypothetical protein
MATPFSVEECPTIIEQFQGTKGAIAASF